MNKTASNVDEYLANLPVWQAQKLQEFRDTIHSTLPEISEEIKWNVPAFVYNSKVVFTMAAFKSHVKYNFILNGASLSDPTNLFNNGLESKTSRSIDIQENTDIDSDELKELVKQALSK